MLRGYGIPAVINGENHASVEFISNVLGGHRLVVSRADYSAACEILRISGVLEHEAIPGGPRPALLRFIAFYLAMQLVLLISANSAGVGSGVPYWAWLALPLNVFTIPVHPRGPADYFLEQPAD